MSPITFTIKGKLERGLGRAGVLETPHGAIETPAFVTVGTKATVKALPPEQVADLGAHVVLANTYHLYLQPGDEIIRNAGGLHQFMNWRGPTMTDSGGFQAFSLGAAFGLNISKIGDVGRPTSKEAGLGTNVSKIAKGKGTAMIAEGEEVEEEVGKLAHIDEDGVTFRSHIDGSEHKFTPEKSIEIQHNIGADMIFAFDECTSPQASYEYQKEALDRTHRWAERSLKKHQEINGKIQRGSASIPHSSALFGIVQGGRFEDLRKESAKAIGGMNFDGFGIGGSFDKEDMHTVIGWVNEILPKEKPRHLLGIGEPMDILEGIEKGCDLFDCVAPTRMARNGTLYTKDGRINILNAQYKNTFSSLENDCGCYTCRNYTASYVAHLFRAKEMFAATLASIHNLYFINKLVAGARQAILDKAFAEYKNTFLKRYYG